MMATREPKSWPSGGIGAQSAAPAAQARAAPTLGRTAPVVPQSRFVEGSMNDRASAAPPPMFLGPTDVAAYERQFYEPDRHRMKPLRSVSSAGYYHHANYNRPAQTRQDTQKQDPPRKGGFWDGVKQRLQLTRSRSSGSIPRLAEKDVGRSVTLPVGVHPGNAGNIGKPMAPTTGYPSREEVLESYKNLMASGFFDAHATKGTRHPLRTGQTTAARPSTTAAAAPMPPPTMSFAAHKQASSRKPPPATFSAVPYSATKLTPPAELTSMLPPPSRRPATSAEEPASPQRGTKRGPGPLDADNDSTKGNTETGARKLVKKLRRSASRVSTDLANPAPTLMNAFKPRPSTSSNAPSFTSLMSNDSDASTAPPAPRTPTKLSKSKYPPRSTRGRAMATLGNLTMSRRRGRSPAPVAPSVAVRRDITPNPLSMNPVTTNAPVFPPPGQAITDNNTIMLLDSPERRSRSPERISTEYRPSMERQATALAPPSFHYPQRRRVEPLAVVEDVNERVFRVPAGQQKGLSPFSDRIAKARECGYFDLEEREKGEGYFDLGFGGEMGMDVDVKMGGVPGTRDSGVGEEVENVVRGW